MSPSRDHVSWSPWIMSGSSTSKVWERYSPCIPESWSGPSITGGSFTFPMVSSIQTWVSAPRVSVTVTVTRCRPTCSLVGVKSNSPLTGSMGMASVSMLKLMASPSTSNASTW